MTSPTPSPISQAAGERDPGAYDIRSTLETITLLCEATGEPCDGFRFRELILKARTLISTAPTTGSAPFLGESDMSALMTFHSQAEDHEADGYTVHKETMKRLAELGVVNNRGFGRYETTAFGAWLVETALEQDPTLPLRTIGEHNARSALLAAATGGDKS